MRPVLAELQVNQRGRDRGVAQPPGQVMIRILSQSGTLS